MFFAYALRKPSTFSMFSSQKRSEGESTVASLSPEASAYCHTFATPEILFHGVVR
jgi:hypothetical protein